MFKPRLRIPRHTSLLRPLWSSASSTASSSPFVVAAQQKHQQRWSHAAPVRPALQVPEAPEKFKAEGIPGLLTPAGYSIAWTNYQAWVIDELNKKVAGTPDEGMDAKKLAIQTSREPGKADIFNFASMAHNNEFFFTGIAPNAGQEPNELDMPKELREHLELSFGSIENLQKDMIFTANAMFGPGFVWLVKQKDFVHQKNVGQYRILTTYLAGSPYPGAHWRRQGLDMNSVGGVSDQGGDKVREYFDKQNSANNRSTLHGSSKQEEERSKSPGGADLIPVLCVNTWEHVWLPDYGCGGKLDFLSNWWRLINWNRVWERALNGPISERTVSPALDPSTLRRAI